MNTKAEDDDGFADRIAAALNRLPAVRRYWIAYSGGLDSTVLLHTLAALRPRLSAAVQAVHVNHALSPAAPEWARHCQTVCAALAVALTSFEVRARPERGESPEAAARSARYAALAGLVTADDCLLTAHHQDDQAETLLLQLLRGSGPHGLAAMPAVTRFAAGWHARPFLDLQRAELRAVAERRGLTWIDDPSNFDTGLRRNYLRHEVLPRLKAVWPAWSKTLARSAAHNAQAAVLLDERAAEDLQALAGPSPEQLSVSGLERLSPERRRNVLRYWLQQLHLPAPSTEHMIRLEHDVLAAAPDRTPLLAWPGAELRRYQDWLYALPPLPAHDPAQILPWDLAGRCMLPGGGWLQAEPARGQGLRADLARTHSITIRFRRGGERCRPASSAHSHALKNLLQERGIPPWERDRIPLIYVDDELAAVADWCICHPFQAAPEEEAVHLTWSRSM